MNPQAVVEWAQAKLLPGVTRAQLMQLSEAMQTEFIARQPGFVSRQVFLGPNGEVGAMLVWESEAALHASMAAARSDAHVRAFAACLEPGTYSMQVFQQIQTY